MAEHTENVSCRLSAVFCHKSQRRFPPKIRDFWERENKGGERGCLWWSFFFFFFFRKKGVGRDLINFEGSSAPFVQGRERGRAGDGGVSEWVERV